MDGLVSHLESVLGPIQEGWALDPAGDRMPFQIVRFKHGSGPGSTAYATLGLGKHGLTSRASGRSIRQELLLLAPDDISRDVVASLLHDAGSAALRTHMAYLR
ncbi:hypothetical protein [Agromyces albus]|uniref:hypothetical protein n=1 Tax=Agromyces albus TaxID=205332 RepID=UPI00277D2579|nr:hypothetical protein [Agromyces albus]MDQ0577191.1 hypothetical protein [Agromyces albus]